MKEKTNLYEEMEQHLTQKIFLRTSGFSHEEIQEFIAYANLKKIANRITKNRIEGERFQTKAVMRSLQHSIKSISPTPGNGWLSYCYNFILGQLFPEKRENDYEESHKKGAFLVLQMLKAVYSYERKILAFDPTFDLVFLDEKEIKEKGFNKEYLKLMKLVDFNFLYEFMRIGTAISPYNTLGHIAGVHYTAMHIARQLEALGVPVDLGIISGAAAGHDIGKYGCKKSEEKRIPYLHYYYTDLCFNQFDMPLIGHIAANHSTWDLELENLSVEALLLIYADFRVKGKRENGKEQVIFYSLEDSFHVILNKLDHVDEAKEKRYRKVYNKLKDFQDYMIDLGVETELPPIPRAYPNLPKGKKKRAPSLISANDAVDEFKYSAVDHNIKLMHKLNSESEFGSILETARSEKQWKNLRTYVAILGEYSTYMTEKQKLMTLRFLKELLVHRESDIRNRAGEIIGQIIARFNEEYKKELPAGVRPPEKEITNITLWEETVDHVLMPEHKLTSQHKKWSENSLKSIVNSVLESVREDEKSYYVDVLTKWYRKGDLTVENKEALIRVAIDISPEHCTKEQVSDILNFADRIEAEGTQAMAVAALDIRGHFQKKLSSDQYYKKLRECLGIPSEGLLSGKVLSDMYLNNLKSRTPWLIKIANIKLMVAALDESQDGGQMLHVATHLGNLIKVSETVTVRKAAGNALISLIGKMPLEQRNEIAVEVGKGLEIGDYQFAKYIPKYLGIIMLHLPPKELDELAMDLEKFLETENSQVAGVVLNTFGVLVENYHIYLELFSSVEDKKTLEGRRMKFLGIIVRAFSNYVEAISQEALWVLGVNIFGCEKLSLNDKYEIFSYLGKKILTLYDTKKENGLGFFNEAAALNKIYQFICQYQLENGDFQLEEGEKVAFFPGTFDPFSLSHKAIAQEIRDMGFQVYLAVDEFSWSKKTQPQRHRRKLLNMSVADQENIYVFPENIPINIANPKDIRKLKDLFKEKDLYFVAGSDVIENASCYHHRPTKDSIHTLNHIVFKRHSKEQELETKEESHYPITGEIINLKLEAYYEDISSTRIRENIDLNRDISNLIDPVAQNYIYEKGLYLREPTYKYVMQAKEMSLSYYDKNSSKVDPSMIYDLEEELLQGEHRIEKVKEYLEREDLYTVVLRSWADDDKVVALASASKLESIELLDTFHNPEIAAFIRNQVAGSIAVIGGLFYSDTSALGNVSQSILVEILSKLIEKDYTYVVYYPCEEGGRREKTIEVLKKQGFINISNDDKNPIYAVNMKEPIVLFKNVDTIVKAPLNKNSKVINALQKAHDKLLKVLREMYPGQVLLSYNSEIIHHKIIKLLTQINGVSDIPAVPKKNGPYMVVPFSKSLENVVVPNTVTKSLHTEKYFYRDVSGFSIEESRFYSTLENQIKTIKSFNKPVILTDDLLNKGYRMKELDPIFKKNEIKVVDTVAGVLTGRGKDLMTLSHRKVDSAYFLPNMKFWLDESALYPYLGGDSMKNKDEKVSNDKNIPALNLLLPYTVPVFLGDIDREKLYSYSMICLENSRAILKILEREYQNNFGQKLTIARLGEVVISPKRPEIGEELKYNENVAPSTYVERDIERLIRMRKMFL